MPRTTCTYHCHCPACPFTRHLVSHAAWQLFPPLTHMKVNKDVDPVEEQLKGAKIKVYEVTPTFGTM